MNIFDWLKEITINKSPSSKFVEGDWKVFDPYMIHRYVSMNPSYVHIANKIQHYSLDKITLYEYYKNVIPKKSVYLKYIKSEQDKEKQLDKELISILTKHFMISSRELKENLFYGVIYKEEIVEILQQYGIDDKEIKKLCKNLK